MFCKRRHYKKPYMFRSLFRDHLQGSSFILGTFTTFQLPASSFVLFGFVAVCHLFVCVPGVPLCVLSGRALPLGQQGHIGGSFAYFAQNAHCTVTTYLLMWYSNTENDFPPEWPFSQYIHSHCLVAEMWITMKNNLLGKKVLSYSFYLYRFRKYGSYGFPIINFCNPGVHYETPCIIVNCIQNMKKWNLLLSK
jgi:hypothetical protein